MAAPFRRPPASPRAIVFDLDGTLIDSRGDIVAAANHALSANGFSPLPGKVVVRYVGNGARALCAGCADLPEDAPEVEALVASFVAYYAAHPTDHTRWMKGALEVLDALDEAPHFTLGLCTNKPRESTDAVLRALGIEGKFAAVFAGGDLPERKPSPEPLLHVAKLLGASPAATVMVGDGPQDVECARAAGMRVVAVGGGFAEEEVLLAQQPDVYLDDLTGLPAVLESWRNPTARLGRIKL